VLGRDVVETTRAPAVPEKIPEKVA
jgi:hypothetical protein